MGKPVETDPAFLARVLRERQQSDPGTIAEWCADLAKHHYRAGREREGAGVLVLSGLFESGEASADAVIDALAGVESDEVTALMKKVAVAADAALTPPQSSRRQQES